MPPLPEAIILVLAAFALLFSHRVWPHAQLLLVGALLAPGARTVTAASRVMGLSSERHFTKLSSRLELGNVARPPGRPDPLGTTRDRLGAP